MSCKSSLCLRGAKVYVDNWVSQVSKMLHEDVIYRHIVLSVPDGLRPTFYQHSRIGILKSIFLDLNLRKRPLGIPASLAGDRRLTQRLVARHGEVMRGLDMRLRMG